MVESGGVIWSIILIKYLYLSGEWIGVDLRMDIKKDMSLREMRLRAQIFLTHSKLNT
jgi:hypothetical protein